VKDTFKDIIIVARQAGTAQAFSPLITVLYELDFRITLISFKKASEIFTAKYLPCIKIAFFDDALNIMNDIATPSFMLTGTSFQADDDALFWNWAKERSIPSLAYVDSWINYKNRFSSGGDAVIADTLPDYIGVVDKLMYTRIKEFGIPKEKIVVLGNPAFDRAVEYKEAMSTNRMDKPTDKSIIAFFSEPNSIEYGITPDSPSFLGFSEEDALRLLIEALGIVGKRSQRNFVVKIKLHPIEDQSILQNKISKFGSFGNVAVEFTELDHLELISCADFIAGMTSTCLYQGMLMDKPVLSLLPNRTKAVDMVDNTDLIKVCENIDDCVIYLNQLIANDAHFIHRNRFKEGPKSSKLFTNFITNHM